MLVLVLTKESNGPYAAWSRYQSFFPQSVDRVDVIALDKLRYYRLVLPLTPDKPPLSPHPLTWSTISHVIWDGMAPETLNPSQQQAMLDWLHWGGQITLVGGAASAFSVLKDSFLGPYLPAEASGENALLSREDLTPLSQAYPPAEHPDQPRWTTRTSSRTTRTSASPPAGFRRPVPINPPPNRPVFLAGLSPRPGAVSIPLGDSGDRLVGVERRVGRGRVLMLGLNPTDPALAVWPGLDTFIRRVILRRPEEVAPRAGPGHAAVVPPHASSLLPGTDLSWVRYLSRDLDTTLTDTAEPSPDPDDRPTLDETAIADVRERRRLRRDGRDDRARPGRPAATSPSGTTPAAYPGSRATRSKRRPGSRSPAPSSCSRWSWPTSSPSSRSTG